MRERELSGVAEICKEELRSMLLSTPRVYLGQGRVLDMVKWQRATYWPTWPTIVVYPFPDSNSLHSSAYFISNGTLNLFFWSHSEFDEVRAGCHHNFKIKPKWKTTAESTNISS